MNDHFPRTQPQVQYRISYKHAKNPPPRTQTRYRGGVAVPRFIPLPIRNGQPENVYLPKDPGRRARLLAAIAEINRDRLALERGEESWTPLKTGQSGCSESGYVGGIW